MAATLNGVLLRLLPALVAANNSGVERTVTITVSGIGVVSESLTIKQGVWAVAVGHIQGAHANDCPALLFG